MEQVQEKVVISLERYTQLIQENAKLETTLKNIKKRAFREVEKESVNEGGIERLSKEQLIALLDDETKAIQYVWTYGLESISYKHYEIVSVKELKEYAMSMVINIAKECLADKENEE